ncbi:MAG: hypothetical protein HC828_13370, partial [Blastochloris sp.]|nr:hypothetical protein [Blastochloris sp.]
MSPDTAPRPALSIQTEQAKQQQWINALGLALLLGPLSFVVAGVLALIIRRKQRWMLACAVLSLIALGVGGWYWRNLLALWYDIQAVATTVQTLVTSRPPAAPLPLWEIAQLVWPPLWRGWQWTLLLAPLGALTLAGQRARSAEELELARIARQQHKDAVQERHARTQAGKAPDRSGNDLVLGIALDAGDLGWQRGVFATYPADNLGRHGAIIGGSGVGKSETMLRLAYGARLVYGWKVFVIDGKGEHALAERFTSAMQAAGAGSVGRFPDRPIAGWRGDPVALLNRLLQVIDYSEAYYRDMTKLLLNLALEAPPEPPRSSAELLSRMQLATLRQMYTGRPEAAEIDGIRLQDAQGAYNRYRAFFKAIQGGLDGAWSFDDVDAGYILLDGLSLKDQAACLGRYLLEDFAHYVARRKPTDERVLLIVDEYPVMAMRGAGAAGLFEMVRFHGASILVTGQSYAGMGEGFERILGAAETLILHRTGDPERLLSRAGERPRFQRRVGIAERGLGQAAKEYATGSGMLAVEEDLAIHPNRVKELPRGMCYVIAGGKAQRVLVKRVPEPASGRAAATPGKVTQPVAVPPPPRPLTIP